MLRRIRSWVLRLAVRHGALTPEVAADLARWGPGGGLSLHAAVLIKAADRAGLERLLLDRLAALITWPRRHRHHHAGGFTCAFDQSPS